MRRRLNLIVALIVIFTVQGSSQDKAPRRLTNQDIITMVQIGLSDDVIIAKIRSASAQGPEALDLDTSTGGLKALKSANVPDAVIKVMINPTAPPAAVVAGATPMTIDPNLPPPEVGVYWKNGANFVLIQGQAMAGAKVGGKAGSLFTDGLRNQHWDAYVEGPRSKNVVPERLPIFYFYVADGSDASDYVLLKLNQKGNRREFQVGSFGGVTGGKSGVKRDKEVPIKAEHVAIRTYKISLSEELKPGPYAFFMATGQSATMSGAKGGNRSGGVASGRIYDFDVPE